MTYKAWALADLNGEWFRVQWIAAPHSEIALFKTERAAKAWIKERRIKRLIVIRVDVTIEKHL